MRNIVLFCAGGMSTSLLVNKMKAAAVEQGYECNITAYGVTQIEEYGHKADVVLLGPQIRYKLSDVKSSLLCPVETIDMTAYGMMDGKRVLEIAKRALGD